MIHGSSFNDHLVNDRTTTKLALLTCIHQLRKKISSATSAIKSVLGQGGDTENAVSYDMHMI